MSVRCLAILWTALAVVEAHADQGLTEADAVQRGLERPEIVDLLAARREAAAGREEAAGRWANPEIEYSREEADVTGGSVEDRYLWVRQRFNIAGVHGLERDAATSQRLAEDARADLERREIAAKIRRLYYQAVAAEREAAAVEGWYGRLAELVTVVGIRAQAGDASRFDALRLERELSLVRGDTLDAQAGADTARDRLFSLIQASPDALTSELLPPEARSVDVSGVLANHPLLLALDAETRAAELSSEAEDRRSWPEVTLGVGRRELDEPGETGDGPLVAVGVEIPVFDNGSGEAKAESARARRLQAERALVESRLAADTRAVIRELAARREAALAISHDIGDSLASIAERAYDAGEISVLELIDAHRTELASRREAIRRAHAARESYISLQMMRGDP